MEQAQKDIQWVQCNEYEDILYHKFEGIAKITINRPEVRNAFRPETVKELLTAFEHAHEDPEVGVVILTGEGTKAFCSGGDQKVRGTGGYIDKGGVPLRVVGEFAGDAMRLEVGLVHHVDAVLVA